MKNSLWVLQKKKEKDGKKDEMKMDVFLKENVLRKETLKYYRKRNHD